MNGKIPQKCHAEANPKATLKGMAKSTIIFLIFMAYFSCQSSAKVHNNDGMLNAG